MKGKMNGGETEAEIPRKRDKKWVVRERKADKRQRDSVL